MARSNPIKGPLLFLGVSALILLLTIFVLAPKQQEKKEKESNATLLWGGLKREEVLSVSFTNPSGQFTVKKDSQGKESWILGTETQNFEADTEAVTGLISTMIAAKTEENLSPPALDQVGLAQPKYRVKVDTTNTKLPQRELLIGNDTPVNYFVYAKWSDSDDIFLTTRSLRFGIDKEAKDFRNKAPFKWALGDLNSIEYTSFGREGLDKMSFSIKMSESGWKLPNLPNALISDAELQKWFVPLETSKAQGFAPETKASPSAYGLDKPIARLSFTHTSGQQQTWVLGSKEVLQGKSKVSEYYLSGAHTSTIYLMKPAFKDSLKLDLFQIREKGVTSFSGDTIDQLKISGPTKTMTFTKKDGAWAAVSNFPGFTEGQGNAVFVDRIVKIFSNLLATKYHDGTNSTNTGLSQPTRTLEFYQGEKLVEKIKVGKKLSSSEVIVLSTFNNSPASVLVNIDEIVPLKPEPFILKESKPEPSSVNSNKEKVKMEPTVKNPSELKKLPSAIVKPGHVYTSEIQVRGKGMIEITFDAAKAPYTVSNFLHLARNRFYNGLKFHRVIPDFVAQGGDPVGNGTGGPGWMFDYEANDLKHQVGSISMAHASDPNTNGSQFFLVFAPQPHLDGVHTVFGQVTKGLDIMNAIKQGDVMETVQVFERAL